MRNRLSPPAGAIQPEGIARLGSASSAHEWKAASPGGAQRCTRRRPAADRLECSYSLSRPPRAGLGQVESRYGSGAAMAKWVGKAAMTAAAVVGLSGGSRSIRSSGEKSRSRKVTISTRGGRAAMAGDGGGGGWWRRAKASQRWRHCNRLNGCLCSPCPSPGFPCCHYRFHIHSVTPSSDLDHRVSRPQNPLCFHGVLSFSPAGTFWARMPAAASRRLDASIVQCWPLPYCCRGRSVQYHR